MSANTKDPVACDTDGARIRSGALAIPLSFSRAHRGADHLALMRALDGIEIPANAEHFVPAGTYLEALARIDHFGGCTAELLRAALAQDVGRLGLLGKAIVHAENLWFALQMVREGLVYFQPGAALHFRLHFGRCRVTYQHGFGDGPAQTLDTQYSVGVLANIVLQCVAVGDANLELRYPGACASHGALFGHVAQVSDGPYGSIEFNDVMLRRPLRRTLPYVSDVVCDVMDALAEGGADAESYATQVRLLQGAAIARQRGPLSQSVVAGLLDLSVRMLQYNLKKEDCRFDSLRDESRHLVARTKLLAGASIREVAQDLGFAHRQSFSEAFSKWEGMAPSVFRSQAHPAH